MGRGRFNLYTTYQPAREIDSIYLLCDAIIRQAVADSSNGSHRVCPASGVQGRPNRLNPNLHNVASCGGAYQNRLKNFVSDAGSVDNDYIASEVLRLANGAE